MLQTLMSVDDMTGSIFRQLRSLGEARNTLAIFTSDNGYLWAEHSLRGKRYPYLESTEVPLILRWPGHVPGGGESSDLVSQIDFLPTALEAAGLSPSLTYPLDGRSLLSPVPRTQALQEYFKSNDSGLSPWASIRGEDWQYVEWYDITTGDISFREYYDLVNDPYQLVNLLRDGDDTNDPDVVQLHQSLLEARTCVGDACP
jgi:arylsulfatase A-like enzyme